MHCLRRVWLWLWLYRYIVAIAKLYGCIAGLGYEGEGGLSDASLSRRMPDNFKRLFMCCLALSIRSETQPHIQCAIYIYIHMICIYIYVYVYMYLCLLRHLSHELPNMLLIFISILILMFIRLFSLSLPLLLPLLLPALEGSSQGEFFLSQVSHNISRGAQYI